MHILKTYQKLPISIEEAWEFFSSPKNLKIITPPYMGFDITSGGDEPMYPGQIITYIVKPIFGIPIEWVTEITHVEKNAFFVDEQRFGPYAFWHHKHYFKPIPGGIEMRDVVHYKIPLGPLGKLINHIYIQHKLKEIFDYRYQTLEKMFGKM
jgi:ligand-binding SRPBCC domain-containing protein